MDFFQKVPKIVSTNNHHSRTKLFIVDALSQELHAHLNGSLSNRTLKELRKLKYGQDGNDDASPSGVDDSFYKITGGQNLSLKE